MRRMLFAGCLTAAVVMAGCGGDEEPMVIAPYEGDIMVSGGGERELIEEVPGCSLRRRRLLGF